MESLISSQIFYALTTILIVIAIANMLMQRKRPKSIISWILVIVTIPYFGVLLYYIFHGRKMKNILSSLREIDIKNICCEKKSFDFELERFISKESSNFATYNSKFFICEDAKVSYKSLLDLIDSAKESIYISTYILGKDEYVKEIISHIANRAKDGVEVKLLIDAVGSQSLELNPKILKPLKEAGGEYKFFMSILKKPLKSKLNLRNHRKMIIVDHTKVMSGGINISKEYFDPKDGWVDLSFVIEGAASFEYEQLFLHNWHMQSDFEFDYDRYKDLEIGSGKSIIHVVPSGPDMDNDLLYESILLAIYSAKKSIYIVSAYFSPEDSIMEALIVAQHRGIDIKVISPKSSDHLFVDIARDAFLRELENEGVKIYLYNKTMLHAKAILIDDSYAFVGSANFDTRSLFYNFEIVSVIYSKEDIMALKRWINKRIDESCFGLEDASKPRVLLENFFKIFSPAF